MSFDNVTQEEVKKHFDALLPKELRIADVDLQRFCVETMVRWENEKINKFKGRTPVPLPYRLYRTNKGWQAVRILQ